MGEVSRPMPTAPAPMSLRAAAGDGVDWRQDQPPSAGDGDSPSRWDRFWTYRSPPCKPIEVGPGGCVSVAERDWDPQRPVIFEGRGFSFEAQIECSAPASGVGLVAEAQDAFDRGASAAIATELWGGAIARGEIDEAGTSGYEGNRWLTRSDDPVSTITELSAQAKELEGGIGMLESYLACCSDVGRGVIHVPPSLVAPMRARNLILDPTTATGRRYSPSGHTIVADCGYDGQQPGPASEGPDNPGNGVLWAYATGPLTVRLYSTTPIGTDEDVAALIAVDNNRVAVVQGMAMVTWGCCHAGVPIDVTDFGLDIAGS